MTETRFTPCAETARDFRDALGAYGTGVTVVTAMTADGPLAMTVNSFSSVSLEPPLVLWSPARESSRHDPFVNADHFAVHVMAEDQLALARQFASAGLNFEGVTWEPDANAVPALPGCLARFACARHAVHDGGDHSIVIGRVLEVTSRPGKGLIFKRGQFGGFVGL
ncbi:MAG: flavin reductase family protein [Rhodobacteraceae bacterium]|nr:flavin reductase family protein [Paracoccaceae bacterium]